mmetsp:Transcript_5072/g.13168  ORF Transcript_5072/g.13168 Transcript_5072/m.13168 type:complete len:310 (-) Transcript_5072:226-1155(-)
MPAVARPRLRRPRAVVWPHLEELDVAQDPATGPRARGGQLRQEGRHVGEAVALRPHRVLRRDEVEIWHQVKHLLPPICVEPWRHVRSLGVPRQIADVVRRGPDRHRLVGQRLAARGEVAEIPSQRLQVVPREVFHQRELAERVGLFDPGVPPPEHLVVPVAVDGPHLLRDPPVEAGVRPVELGRVHPRRDLTVVAKRQPEVHRQPHPLGSRQHGPNRIDSRHGSPGARRGVVAQREVRDKAAERARRGRRGGAARGEHRSDAEPLDANRLHRSEVGHPHVDRTLRSGAVQRDENAGEVRHRDIRRRLRL